MIQIKESFKSEIRKKVLVFMQKNSRISLNIWKRNINDQINNKVKIVRICSI